MVLNTILGGTVDTGQKSQSLRPNVSLELSPFMSWKFRQNCFK